MRVIAYETKSLENGKGILIKESTGEEGRYTQLDTLMGFLFEPMGNSDWKPPFDGCLRVCWDLDITVTPILQMLGGDNCLRLSKTHKCRVPPFSFFYAPGKIFAITHIPTKQKVYLYRLSQYYPELEQPATLGDVQALGVKLVQTLKQMGMEPHRLTSPVAIYEDSMLQFLDLPTWADMPKGAAEMAYKTSGQLFIEAHRIGYWNMAYSYDKTSSFPMKARELKDIRQCDWIETPIYQNSALYGYCKGEVTIYDGVMLSPIFYTDEAGGLSSRVGTWPTYLSKGQIDFLGRCDTGEFKIEDGWWAIPRKGEILKYPLQRQMDRLLSYKAKGGLEGMIAKRQSTGIYGKTLQLQEDGAGPYFNPVWGAEISISATLEVAEWLYRHGIGPSDNEGYKHLLQVTVDGATLDEPVAMMDTDKGWRLSNVGPALIVSSGMVYEASKKPQGLTLDDVLELIKAHPRQSFYRKAMRRRLTLTEAVEAGMDKLGQEVEVFTGFNLLSMQHDREFKTLPRTGGGLLSRHYLSTPKSV